MFSIAMFLIMVGLTAGMVGGYLLASIVIGKDLEEEYLRGMIEGRWQASNLTHGETRRRFYTDGN